MIELQHWELRYFRDMGDELIAANRTKSGTCLKTCSDSARFSCTKSIAKHGGSLSGHTGFERRTKGAAPLPRGATPSPVLLSNPIKGDGHLQ
jgi:hypothetical protein